MGHTAHLQSLRNPSHRHQRLFPQPNRYLHLFRIATIQELDAGLLMEKDS
jgi:hypothetical protein